MKRIFAAAAALSLCAFAAAAQLSEPEKALARFTADEVRTILNEAGLPSDIGTREDGSKLLRVTSPGGLVFFVEPKACGETGCRGLLMTAMFRREAGFAFDKLNAYNRRYVFMKAFQNQAGDAVLTRYVTADYGIPSGNVAVNAVVFERLARKLSAYMAAPAPKTAIDPQADGLPVVENGIEAEDMTHPGAAHAFILDEETPAEDMVNRM